MTSDEYFDFYYPYFKQSGDPRFADATSIGKARNIALTKAPECENVTVEQIAEAVAHYMAYLLESIYANKTKGSGVSQGSVLISEKEGNVEKRYSSGSTATIQTGASGPTQPYELWQAIANLCPQVGGFSLRTRRV